MWRCAKRKSAHHIDLAIVRQAKAAVTDARNDHYLERHNELEHYDLLAPAIILAQASANQSWLDEVAVIDALTVWEPKMDSTNLRRQRDALQGLGYIWQGKPGKTD